MPFACVLSMPTVTPLTNETFQSPGAPSIGSLSNKSPVPAETGIRGFTAGGTVYLLPILSRIRDERAMQASGRRRPGASRDRLTESISTARPVEPGP